MIEEILINLYKLDYKARVPTPLQTKDGEGKMSGTEYGNSKGIRPRIHP